MQILGVRNQEAIPEYIAIETPMYQKVVLAMIVYFHL
jgi:hypothetical protein